MVEGEHPDDDVLAVPSQPAGVLDGIGGQIVMSQHCPFGQTGGAAGVFDGGDVFSSIYLRFRWCRGLPGKDIGQPDGVFVRRRIDNDHPFQPGVPSYCPDHGI